MFYWLEKFFRTDISLRSHQHGQFKDDIFIFHGTVGELLDRMKLSWRHDNDVAAGHLIGNQIHGDGAGSFFDIYDFHIIVPMSWHNRKIQRDAAQINVEGEIIMSVWFCFLGAFVFCDVHMVPSLGHLIVLYYFLLSYCKKILEKNHILYLGKNLISRIYEKKRGTLTNMAENAFRRAAQGEWRKR